MATVRRGQIKSRFAPRVIRHQDGSTSVVQPAGLSGGSGFSGTHRSAVVDNDKPVVAMLPREFCTSPDAVALAS